MLATALAEAKFATDRTAGLSKCFSRYFSGVSVKANAEKDDPERQFFRYKVVQQVRGNSYWRAWKDGLRSQAQLVGVPAAVSNACAFIVPVPRTPTSASWAKCSHRRPTFHPSVYSPELAEPDRDS